VEGDVAKNIPAHGKIKLKFNLSVSEKSDTPEVKFVFHFRQGQTTQINEVKGSRDLRVYVSYRPKGLIAFQGKLVSLEVPEGVALGELRANFVYTAPLEMRNFAVSASEGIRDIYFEMKKNGEGSGVLVGSVPISMLRGGPIGGEVLITDQATGRKSSVWVTARLSEPFKLSPLTLTFRKNKINNNYQATALLGQVLSLGSDGSDKIRVDGNSADDLLDNIDVSCVSGAVNLSVVKTPLGSRTIRLDFSMTEEQLQSLDSDSGKVQVLLRIGTGNFEVERHYSVHK
jgi:hypothetical protein